MNIYPVILCGGSGTRLWPMSRGGYPKQYLRLTGEHTLVQQTALRLRGIGNVAGPIMITNEDQRFIVAEQMRSIAVEPSAIVLEPMGRDTAPAVAVAALLALQATPDALLLVLPSDHVIQDDAVFGKLATITEPHTGYGYIRGGEALAATDGTYRVERFVEKPDAVTAARLLEEGGYYWNDVTDIPVQFL